MNAGLSETADIDNSDEVVSTCLHTLIYTIFYLNYIAKLCAWKKYITPA